MKVQIYPADRSGCGSYRCIWPAEAVDAAYDDIDVSMHLPRSGQGLQVKIGRLRANGREVVAAVGPVDADVVVLQRPLLWQLVDTIPHLQRQGVAVVVEVDDDFEAVHRQNVNWRLVQARHDPGSNKDHLMRACQMADLVITSTPAIATRYGQHGRVHVIPNFVPARYLTIDREEHDDVVVGWAGDIETHPTDLQAAGHRVARALRGAARFKVIGNGRGVRNGLRLDAEPEHTTWVPIEEYPSLLATLDVAIAPLEAHPFNDAKSWLKPLEAAAVGVPTVASPAAEYQRFADLGGCLLARTPGEWESQLRRLVRDAGWRAEAGARARAVAEQLTIEAHARLWVDAWSQAVINRYEASPADQRTPV